ncbi:MAG: aldolase [Nocardioidaceae bacterium]|nr:aldolase [Nocardioidaceae bacterium]
MTADLDALLAGAIDARLADADADLARRFPGDAARRQPVHTVYVPADRYHGWTVPAWGEQARAELDRFGDADLAAVWQVGVPEAAGMRARLEAKLEHEPVEDLRIDLEDGYGVRRDTEEDEHVLAAARALAASPHSPFSGIRVKCLEPPVRRRGLRTLRLFLETLAAAGGVPDGFVVTLPKVTSVDQVAAFAEALDLLEASLGLGRVPFEIQVETPQAILGPDGTALVAKMLHAAGGRVTGLHYGTYDYSASLGVAAAQQSLEHPVADHAKAVMQVAAAGTGVFVSDGSSNVLPVGSNDEVRAAWSLHARLVRRSLAAGLYQGWDLHPAQLVSRYGATYAFFRDGFGPAARRLRDYVRGVEGGVLDEPATAAAMAGFLLRALECGAVDATDLDTAVGIGVTELTGLSRRATAGAS